jgi:hypothetical protein
MEALGTNKLVDLVAPSGGPRGDRRWRRSLNG